MPSKPDPVADYRHDATRKNNPPAALASQGHIREVPKQRYYYDPHLPPVLRFDDTGQSDRLPELLEEATRRKLTAEEASTLSDALGNRQRPGWSGPASAKKAGSRSTPSRSTYTSASPRRPPSESPRGRTSSADSGPTPSRTTTRPFSSTSTTWNGQTD